MRVLRKWVYVCVCVFVIVSCVAVILCIKRAVCIRQIIICNRCFIRNCSKNVFPTTRFFPPKLQWAETQTACSSKTIRWAKTTTTTITTVARATKKGNWFRGSDFIMVVSFDFSHAPIMQKVRSVHDQIASPKRGTVAPLEPVDYTYGRLYEEKRLYLNKSGTKFIALGVRPGASAFKREIRLQSGGLKPFTLLLERTQLIQLYSLIKELPNIHVENPEYVFDYKATEEELRKPSIKLIKTNLGDDIFQVVMPDGQFMFLGIVSLRKLVDLEVFIFSAYDEMDADYLKKMYDAFVAECMQLNYEDYTFDYVIRKSLFQTAMTSWNDRSFYSQTFIHFIDFVVAHITALRHKQT